MSDVETYKTLDPQERTRRINEYIARQTSGEHLSDDELRDDLRLIRADREARTTSSAKTPAQKKEVSESAQRLQSLFAGIE